MTKNEFLLSLREALADLPQDEVKKAVIYYAATLDDRIEDGMDEQTAVASLGDIDDIAREIRESMPINVLVKRRFLGGGKMSGLKIAAIACGFPIWFPLGIALLAIIFSLYAVIWSLVIALLAVLLALGLAGVAGVVGGIVNCFIIRPVTGFMMAGIGLACIGLFLMAIKPAIRGVKALCGASAKVGRGVKRALLPRKGVR